MPAADRRKSLRSPAGIARGPRRLTLALLLAAVSIAATASARDDQDAAIHGRVRFEGPPPARATIRMTTDAVCDALFPAGRRAETVVVDATGGVANVLVYVASGLPEDARIPPPPAPVQIRQKGCAFVPHVLGMRVGQELEIRNDDATLHDVHARAGVNSAFTASLPGEGAVIRKMFQRAEVAVRLKSDRHPWMAAWIGVFDHPWFAVTGPDGSFTIPGLPEGEYTVTAWHESLGERSARLELEEGGRVSLDFAFAGN